MLEILDTIVSVGLFLLALAFRIWYIHFRKRK